MSTYKGKRGKSSKSTSLNGKQGKTGSAKTNTRAKKKPTKKDK